MINKQTLTLIGPAALAGVLFAIMVLIGGLLPVRAATPTPSPSPDTEDAVLDVNAKQTIEEIKKRIEKNRSKVQGTIDDLLQKRRGFIGEVLRVTGESITVENADGTTIIALSQGVTVTKDDEAIQVDDIAVGNWAIVMGSVQDDVSIEPQFVEIYEETLQPEPKTVELGTITNINASEITLTSRSTGEKLVIELSTSTEYQNADGTEISRTDFEEDMNCLITGTISDGSIEALTVRSLAPLDV